MRQMNIAVAVCCLVAVVAGYLPQGPDYSQYDPKKLQERYDIIQALVRPKTAYRPRIGSAYAQKGYKKGANYGGFIQPAYTKQVYAPVSKPPVYAPASTVYAPGKNSGYFPVKNTGYVPVQNTGYVPVKNTGYATGYVNPAPKAPVNYGFQGYGGIRFGGGKVHPIFNNNLLYKNNRALGPYDSTDPIFIGGGPTKATPSVSLRNAPYGSQNAYNTYRKQTAPQIDAYGNRPNYAYPYY